MRIAHFDCAYGISGDMVLGALVDAGLEAETLEHQLRRLPVKGWRLERHTVKRCGIAATRVSIVLSEDDQPHRRLADIKKIIADGALPQRVAERATRAFQRLAEAEAQAHQIDPGEVHFHEVGAVDAIIDICGAMLGIELLGIERVTASALNVGEGRVRCEHGEMPVPAPATALLVRGVPVYSDGTHQELTTPTGAAIITTLAAGFGPLPYMTVKAVGNGAGRLELAGRTNFLRVLVGETHAVDLPLEVESLLLLTTEIDDMSSEVLAGIIDRGLERGALDVHLESIQMKKGRLATRVTILAPPDRRQAMIELLLKETSTFGVKVHAVERHCLRRRFEQIDTPWGPVRVKIGTWGDEILRITPEYEDCRAIANRAALPLIKVFQEVEALIRQTYGPLGGSDSSGGARA